MSALFFGRKRGARGRKRCRAREEKASRAREKKSHVREKGRAGGKDVTLARHPCSSLIERERERKRGEEGRENGS